MIFDDLGLPKEEGATDLQDSARLAGIMTVFEWPREINLSQYVTKNGYVRHPSEIIYDFSRDQATCLMAGLYWQARSPLVNTKFITGKDLMSPSWYGHYRRCKGQKPNWFQNLWFWFDIVTNCYLTPMSEPNQLLCMMMVSDDKYLRYWVTNNKVWMESIRGYFSGWRGEPELAEHMIGKIRLRLGLL